MAKKPLLVNDVKLQIFSSMVPTIVEPKGVFTCPGLHEFITLINQFAAHKVIWSSMKRSTIVEIVDYIFQELPKPFNILGQDSCRKIQTSSGNYLTIIGRLREIYI